MPFDPTVEDWPTSDPAELLEFVQGIPDDGQRRLARALATALIQYRQVIEQAAEDRAGLRAQVDALEARVAAPEPAPSPQEV